MTRASSIAQSSDIFACIFASTTRLGTPARAFNANLTRRALFLRLASSEASRILRRAKLHRFWIFSGTSSPAHMRFDRSNSQCRAARSISPWWHPSGLHSSTVHASSSLHPPGHKQLDVPPTQTPCWQVSPDVQALPSSQGVPSSIGPPTQTPRWQASPDVQALPSSQVAPSGLGGLEHTPLAGSHVPGSWHWSAAAQVLGTHTPQLRSLMAPKHGVASHLRGHLSLALHWLPGMH